MSLHMKKEKRIAITKRRRRKKNLLKMAMAKDLLMEITVAMWTLTCSNTKHSRIMKKSQTSMTADRARHRYF